MASAQALPKEASQPTSRFEAREVNLWIGKRAVLDDVTFAVRPGEVFGILGPNGSGKSSLMQCISGLRTPAPGTFWLDGKPLNRHARANVGVVFQEPSLDLKLTARENLLLSAAIFGVPCKEAKARAQDLLAYMELADRADEQVSNYSGGMRRRLEIARALIHGPQLLLLDEPTNGLDFYAVEKTWRRLLALREQRDLTLVFSTHNAYEAARCDRIGVLDRGHLVACDTPEALLRRVSGDWVTLRCRDPEAVSDLIRSKLNLVPAMHGFDVVVEHPEGHTLVPKLANVVSEEDVESIAVRRPTLADAFFKLTGRYLDQEQEGDAT